MDGDTSHKTMWIPVGLALPLEGKLCNVQFDVNTGYTPIRLTAAMRCFMQGGQWYMDNGQQVMVMATIKLWRYVLEPVDSSGLVLTTREAGR